MLEELMKNRTKNIKWGFIKGQQMLCLYMSQGLIYTQKRLYVACKAQVIWLITKKACQSLG